MYQIQDNPSYFSLADNLQKTKSYTESFDRCRNILQEIEHLIECRILSYFSVFKPSTGIIDSDANFIEDLLRCENKYKPLVLILSSPGGQAVAAEKILLVCKSYATINETSFYTLIPKSAKSAATIIALGSDKILMSKTAELGAIDPQLVVSTPLEKGRKVEEETINNKKTTTEEKLFENITNIIPAFRIKKAVETLLNEAGAIQNIFRKGMYNLFLGQYGYDVYLMAKNEFKLSEDILKKIIDGKKEAIGSNQEFADACRIFFDPELTLSHNRPITIYDLGDSPLHKTGFIQDFVEFYKKSGLDEDKIKKLDTLLWEYFVRTNAHLEDDGNPVTKTIETSTYRFHLTTSGQCIPT